MLKIEKITNNQDPLSQGRVQTNSSKQWLYPVCADKFNDFGELVVPKKGGLVVTFGQYYLRFGSNV